jgi:SurA-like protein
VGRGDPSVESTGVRSIRSLLVVSLATILLVSSACGDRFVAPAAVVQGQRISTETLRHEYDLLVLDPQLRQQVAGTAGEKNRKDLTRRLLAYLIVLRIVEGYARAQQISVSSTDVDQAVQDAISSVGGEAQLQQELKARGLTMAGLRRNIGRQLLVNRVVDSVAAQAGLPSTATEQEKSPVFQRWLSQRLRSSHVEVNPRYGRLDPRSGQILPINSTTA